MLLVQGGNSDAFGLLFDRYKAPIWSWLVRRTRSQTDANELYQEVFLRVWKSAKTFKPGQPVKPWLYRIAANLANDRSRRSQRRIQTTEYNEALAGDTYWRPATSQPSNHEVLDLEAAIAALPETLREAFLLGPVQGLDHNELAAALGVSPANARRRVSRAREKLREILASTGRGHE